MIVMNGAAGRSMPSVARRLRAVQVTPGAVLRGTSHWIQSGADPVSVGAGVTIRSGSSE